MNEVTPVESINHKRHIAILDTSSVSFMHGLKAAGIEAETVLRAYDLILIPEWVLIEIKDSEGREAYVQSLISKGYPIFRIAEEKYSELANYEEGNLYQIVLASTYQIAAVKSYLRRFVEKKDPIDMDAYKDWINRLYEEWPISDQILESGRIRKKNAGEISITVLAEVISWYSSEIESLTIYSQDSDTYAFQCKAEALLQKIFTSKVPLHISYKSNDAILCQLFREGKISLGSVQTYRKDVRKITYSKEQEDYSNALITEIIDNEKYVELIKDNSVHIIF